MYDLVNRCYIFDCRFCGQAFRTHERFKRYCSGRCYSLAHPPKPRTDLWTHQEIRILRELAGRVPCKEIAARLGRTCQAVMSKAQSMKLSLKLYGERSPQAKYSDAFVEQARTLYDEGVKPKAIAARLSIPYYRVQAFVYYRDRLGSPIEHYS
jgi:hypothetical protein